MISQSIVRSVEHSAKNLFTELGLDYTDDVKITVEQLAHLEHGEVASPVFFNMYINWGQWAQRDYIDRGYFRYRTGNRNHRKFRRDALTVLGLPALDRI